MAWLGVKRVSPDDAAERERARERLLDQERRVQALDRVMEVVQRTLAEDRP
jgi:hypothetical protein